MERESLIQTKLKMSYGYQGIYRSTDSGLTFTQMDNTTDIFDGVSQAWYDLAISASNTNQNEIYVGVLNIWKSSNGGNSFSQVNIGKTISFLMRGGSTSGKYYLKADWKSRQRGGDVVYGNDLYVATTASATAYLQVIRKRLQKTKRKDRVVKGMRV